MALLNRAHVSDALRFWETGRIAFNLALLALTVGGAFLSIGADASRFEHWLMLAPALLVLAAVANLLYCAAYPVDLLAQASEFREPWRRWRWLLWAAGTGLALLMAAAMLWGVSLGGAF